MSEADEQRTLFDWVKWNMKKYPDLWFLHHIPNGGTRNVIEASNLKKQGVKAGVSDLFLPVARGEYHGLYLELKVKGGKISDNQSEWINRVRKNGYGAFVVYGFGETRAILEWYLNLVEVGVK